MFQAQQASCASQLLLQTTHMDHLELEPQHVQHGSFAKQRQQLEKASLVWPALKSIIHEVTQAVRVQAESANQLLHLPQQTQAGAGATDAGVQMQADVLSCTTKYECKKVQH